MTCLPALLFAPDDLLCMPQRQPASMLCQVRHPLQGAKRHLSPAPYSSSTKGQDSLQAAFRKSSLVR